MRPWDTAGMAVSRILVCLALAGCGGGQTSTRGGDPSAAADCEPGRCLDDIAKTVKEHRAEARACFDARIAAQPDIQGERVLINFAIEADGTVSDASQSVKGDQIEDAEMVECIANVIRGITFSKSANGKRTRAYHSFEFAR